MWRVVYVAMGDQLAKRIKETLTDDGFLVMLRSPGTKNVEGDHPSKGPVEVLVPEAELEDALERITEIVAGGGR